MYILFIFKCIVTMIYIYSNMIKFIFTFIFPNVSYIILIYILLFNAHIFLIV